ncbi:MAG: pyridoxal-phosphate dependent enzyme [Saprospiraceae bacterium]|nr:pyridoxal-phosphate dependent enzyme [Saprospiraceae bacterium]
MILKLSRIPTRQDVDTVHEGIRAMIHRTPVIRSQGINDLTGADIYFKCENFQKVGAFKMRGASSAVSALSPEQRAKGIATHSSGNHAQAAALSARLFGTSAHIVMPENAPAIKRTAVESYGAKIYTSGSRVEDREKMIRSVLDETGATFIHPYNNYNIIAGQATAAKELLEDCESLQIIMAPVGGGGLLSGTSLSSKYHDPQCVVLGAEPKLVDDAYRSFHSGKIEQNERIDTIADGLRTTLGDKTLEIIRKYVDDILTVSEESIIGAMRLMWERMKIVVEPSGAVPLAAVLEQPEIFRSKKVGIIVSGGNVDLSQLPF